MPPHVAHNERSGPVCTCHIRCTFNIHHLLNPHKRQVEQEGLYLYSRNAKRHRCLRDRFSKLSRFCGGAENGGVGIASRRVILFKLVMYIYNIPLFRKSAICQHSSIPHLPRVSS